MAGYDRYSGVAQVRLGSDELGLMGLVKQPQVPPTLLTGNITVDPTANDNQAGLTVTVGVTQFLHRGRPTFQTGNIVPVDRSRARDKRYPEG